MTDSRGTPSREPIDRLAEDFLARHRRGEWPQISEYLERHPELADEIRAVFPPLVLMERAAQAGPAAEPGRIGPYRTIRLLGAGGQGEVFLAEDTRLGRRVALKVLRSDTDPDGPLMARFRREAAITARLDHPGICTIYEAGEHEGTAYIAMRYVEGPTLADRIRDLQAGTAAAGAPDSATREGALRLVAIAERAARALHAAHGAGLVHRDIKPGNILLTEAGDPVIVDFGLARDVADDQPALTQTGMRMGTPIYMSPEQIKAERVRVDHRTDIYSLGVTLYECLTLRRPFEAATWDQLYHQILATEPEAPRRLNPVVPRDLQVVLATAMEKDRDRRYQTALDFAEDLRRVRELEPIRARPAGPVLRLRRWAQRNPVVATSLTMLFVALVAGLLVSASLLRETMRQRDAKAAALRRAGGLGLAARAHAVVERDPSLALALGVEAARRAPGPQANEALLRALERIRERKRFPIHAGGGSPSVLFLDGGERLFAGNGTDPHLWRWGSGEEEEPPPWTQADALVPSPDGRRMFAMRVGSRLPNAVFDAGARETLATLSWPESLKGFWAFDPAFSPDGGLVLVCATRAPAVGARQDARCVCVWDATTGTVAVELKGADRAAFRPDGKELLAAGPGAAFLWRPGGTAERVFTADTGKGERLLECFWEGAGPRLALVDGDARTVRIVDARTGAPVRALEGHAESVTGLIAAPDGTHLLSLCLDSSATFWAGERRLGTVDLEEAFGRDISTALAMPLADYNYHLRACFSPDGRTALLHYRNFNSGVLIDFAEGRIRARLVGHQGGIAAAAFHPDGHLVATVSADGTARLWDAGARAPVVDFVTPGEDGTHVLAFRDDGAQMLTITDDQVLRVWDAATGTMRWATPPDERTFWGAFVPGDDRVLTLVATGLEPRVHVHARDGATGRELPLPEPLREPAEAIEPGPDGRRLVVRADGEIRVLDAATGATVTPIRPEAPEDTWTFAWSPDGRLLATVAGAGPVEIWDAETGRRIAALPHPDGADQFRFVPGRDLVATAGGDAYDFRLWRLPGGELLCALEGHRDWIPGMAVNGRLAATASGDGTARVWDLDARRQLYCFAPAMGTVNGVRFDPAGTRLATVAQDGEAQLWDLGTGDLLYRVPRREGRRAEAVTYEPGDTLAAFTPDGTRLATATWTDTVKMWPVDPLAAALAWGPRPLTPEETAEYLTPLE